MSFVQPEGTGARAAAGLGPIVFAASFTAAACALLSLRIGLDAAQADAPLLLICLTATGCLVSLAARSRPALAAAAEIGATVVFALMAAGLVADVGPFRGLVASGAFADRQQGMALFLGWLLVYLSFTQSSGPRMLFMTVPSLSLFGVVGTMTVEPELMYLFVGFTCATVFFVLHEHRGAGRAPERTASGRVAAGHVTLTVVCVAAAMAGGRLLAVPIHYVGSEVLFPMGLMPMNRGGDRIGRGPVVTMGEANNVDVGTGPVTKTDTVLLRVRSPEPALWRGATYDAYTGHGWRNTLSHDSVPRVQAQAPFAWGADERLQDRGVTVLPERTAITATPGTPRTLRHAVSVAQNAVVTQLYGAGEMRSVRLIPPYRSWRVGIVMQDAGGALSLATPLPGLVYIIESEMPQTDPVALRTEAGPTPDEVSSRYIALDDMAPDALAGVRAEAEKATAGRRTKYDRVEALRMWVASRCKYNLAAAAAPTDQDIVRHFLFESREGYCDSFATSLAVLCRSLGIPARVASGFATGDYESSSRLYLVRDRDKHMWTEVYFAGFGWVPFDATSDAEDVTPRPGAAVAAAGRSLWQRLRAGGPLPILMLLVGFAALAYVLKSEVFDRRRALRGAPALSPEVRRIMRSYACACAALARLGLRRSPSETADEFAARAVAQGGLGAAAAPMRSLTALVVSARYAVAPAPEGSVARAEADAAELRRSAADLRRQRGRSRRGGV
ncbi:MAG: transglutaminaseTgpA domain-containing protein [Armatimonadetes bacterium]|nr:transglutaminaseTgpA domain-containing protein [Armatimonadota bacterium]